MMLQIKSATEYKVNSENWFLFTFSFWSALDILQSTHITGIFDTKLSYFFSVTNWIVLGMLLIKIVWFQKYDGFQELLFMGLISIVVIISTVFSGEKMMLSLWLFIVASKGVNIDTCVRRAYVILMVMLPLVLILHFIGLIPEYVTYRRGYHIRHSLGFLHPNTLGMRVFQLAAYHFYLHRDDLRLRDFLILLALGVFAFVVPNSQSSVVAIAVLFSLFIIKHIMERRSSRLLKGFSCSLFVIAIIANVISVYYGIMGVNKGTFIDKIDRFLTYRFSFIHTTYSFYGIKWFGQKVLSGMEARLKLGKPYNTDNAYMILLIRYGILIYSLFSVAYLLLMYLAIRRKQIVLVIIFSVFSLYGITENGIFSLTYNVFLLAFAEIVYRYKEEEQAGINERGEKIILHNIKV